VDPVCAVPGFATYQPYALYRFLGDIHDRVNLIETNKHARIKHSVGAGSGNGKQV
jgi:hypothetical protein